MLLCMRPPVWGTILTMKSKMLAHWRTVSMAGEHPTSGPEFNHEVVSSHLGLCDNPACDPPVLEEVLAQLTPAPAPIVAPFLFVVTRIGLCLSPDSSPHSSGSPSIFRMSSQLG
jgi:hypothetical protein